MHPRIPTLLALLVLLLPALPACEGYHRAHGVVIGPSGRPVPGVMVNAANEEGDPGATEATDSAGRFDLSIFGPMVGRNRVWVTVDEPGYRVIQRRAGPSDDLRLVLVPDATPRRERPDWGPAEWETRVGLHYGIPLGLSGTLGVSWGRHAGWNRYQGIVLGIEPGGGGIKGRAGVTMQRGRLGAELAAAALRTLDDPLDAAPKQTFAGAEARAFFTPFALTVGGYTRLAGSAPGEESLVLVSFGLGR